MQTTDKQTSKTMAMIIIITVLYIYPVNIIIAVCVNKRGLSEYSILLGTTLRPAL